MYSKVIGKSESKQSVKEKGKLSVFLFDIKNVMKMFSISMRLFSCSITNANNVVYLFEFFTRLPLMMGAKSHGKPHQCSNESERSKICSRTIPTQMHSIFMDDDI